MPGIDRRLIQNFDWPLFSMAVGLACIGVVNLISAAPESASAIPETAWRQLAWLGVSLGALLFTLLPDYRSLERIAVPLYAICVVMLVVVLIWAPVINGSQRWLIIGGFHAQPSELTKLALLVLFARILGRAGPNREVGLTDLALPALLVAVPTGLILRQPDLGTAVLVAIVPCSFLLIARVRFALLASLAAAAVIAAAGGWFFYLLDYQKQRLLTFLYPERDPLGAAYHSIQSQIAVGSGGVFGKGFNQGPQSQLDFLPEQQTDFVFSVLGEEWGFLGAAIVLVLYLALLIRGLAIARASKDLFGAFLAIGVVAMLFWPTAINIAMVLGSAPVVGIALPFLSYGGSALITSLIGIGLLMNISMRRYLF